MSVELNGFRYSVYTWIARLALLEKGVAYQAIEVNPFSESGHPAHPFGKVPLFIHDGFRLYETAAITKYVDAAFPGPSLMPKDVQERARIDQIICIIDNYAYWPLVRQLFAHGIFLKAIGQSPDQAEFAAGMKAAPRVLSALDALICDQGVMQTGQVSLADIHLGPVISYSMMVPEMTNLLAACDRLSDWWRCIAARPGMLTTKPRLPVV